MRDFKGYLMIMGAATLWGLSATMAKELLNQQVSTLLIVQTRVTFSCLLMLVFFLAFRTDVLKVTLSDLWRFALLGIVGVAGANFTYYFTIKESTVATGILIQYSAPIIVMAYAVAAGDEEFTFIKLVAALCSLVGCAFAVGAFDPAVLRITPVGLVSGIGSVFSFAFLNIYTRRLLSLYNLWTVTFYSIAFASLFWMALNPPWKIITASPHAGVWGALFFLAILSVLIPHSLFFSGLRFVVPTRAVITSTLEPIVAVSSAAIVLGEFLNVVQIMGAVLVLLAIVLLQLRREPHVRGACNSTPSEQSHAP